MREECSDLNLEPWTEPAGSICVCVVVSALRGPDIMRPFYTYCVLSLYVILAGVLSIRV